VIDEVLTPIPQLGTQEPDHESNFWWINSENTVTLEEIAALSQYQEGKEFTYHTPSDKSNSIWYTQYPDIDLRSTQCFEIRDVWGGNNR